MAVEMLETTYVTGSYDEEFNVLKIVYHKILTTEVTNSVYRWLGRVIPQNLEIVAAARGSVYDFREVKHFDIENLLSAQQNSMHLNVKFDMRNHPVALIVRTKAQRDYVSLTLKATPEESRKRIVETMDEAVKFIAEFHAQREDTKPKQDDNPEPKEKA